MLITNKTSLQNLNLQIYSNHSMQSPMKLPKRKFLENHILTRKCNTLTIVHTSNGGLSSKRILNHYDYPFVDHNKQS